MKSFVIMTSRLVLHNSPNLILSLLMSPPTSTGIKKKSPHNCNQPWQQRPKTTNHTQKPYLGQCQIYGVQGHSSRRCSQLSVPALPASPTQRQPNAHFSSTTLNQENLWLMDSGATHHISSDLSNLALHQPYTRGEEVIIGNGSGLSFMHTGSTILPSTTHPLSLTNILYVPDKKNLVSIYKLCNTKVSVEFFSSCFQVKDLFSGDP